jgi:hypothetical protein
MESPSYNNVRFISLPQLQLAGLHSTWSAKAASTRSVRTRHQEGCRFHHRAAALTSQEDGYL